MTKVRILRVEPNSTAAFSSQYVSTADVSEATAILFESYRKKRLSLDEALGELEHISKEDGCVEVPFSVYVNIHQMHASIYFIQTDLMNRTKDIEESLKLAKMKRGLRVCFKQNRFQIINKRHIRRIDLYTSNGMEYKIEMNGDILNPGIYSMFKCYEMIGFSDYDVEWAYLMAAKDWYDPATNNCLSFSKRIITELHKQVTNGSDLEPDELRKLKQLYISSKSETFFDGFESRLSSFMNPKLFPICVCIVVMGLVIAGIVTYVEIRLKSCKQ